MATRKMPWYEFEPNTFEIDEFDCASIFLLVGTKRALLLDTGIGIGDLKGLVESITDKPYDVVMTHGHGDHTGGAGWFDSFYLNKKDWEAYPFPETLERRIEYTETIAKREHKSYPYSVKDDIRPWPKMPERKPLEDGQIFDLGDRKVIAYECPGHTPGEMVFIDDKTRILFAGDACNNNLGFLSKPGTPQFVSVETAGRALKRIWNMRNQYDTVYNSHHDFRGLGAPLADYVLPNAIQCCEELVKGTANIIQIPNPMDYDLPKVSVASLDGKSWIRFNPEGIKD